MTEDALADAAVTGRKLAPGAITADHLALSVLPRIISGTAADAELVLLPGTWAEKPVVDVTSFKIEEDSGEILPDPEQPSEEQKQTEIPPQPNGIFVGITDLREEPEKSGTWMFTACVRVRDEQEERHGTLEWIAFGRGEE